MFHVPDAPLLDEGNVNTTMGSADDEVISFFDNLLLSGVALPELVREAAAWVDGVVGVQLIDGTTHESGRINSDTPGMRASLPQGGQCWIRTAHGSSELIIRRLRVAVQLLTKGTGRTESPFRTLLREGGATAAGAHALNALGVSAHTPVYAVWLNGEASDRQILVDHLESLGNQIVGRIDDSATTILAVDAAAHELKFEWVPLGIRTAFSGPRPLTEANELWDALSVAARFALPATRSNGPFNLLDGIFVSSSLLRAFSLLAEIDVDVITQHADVAAISRIVAEEGSEVLRILEAYAVTRSMRKASEMLFVHYNTVAYWVHKSEKLLGHTTSEPYRQAHLFLTLCLYRLSTTGAFKPSIP